MSTLIPSLVPTTTLLPQLVSSAGHTTDSLALLLELAQRLRNQLDANPTQKHWPLLQGRTVCTLFLEPSTRTRCSFELAAKYLGAHVLNFEASASSFSKGETIADTIETLLQLGVDAFIIRTGDNGFFEPLLAQFGHRAHFINAGEGTEDHPTQALLDLLTLTQQVPLAELAGKKLTIVGDVNHSRVAHATLKLLPGLGLKLHLAGPEAFVNPALAQRFSCTVHHTLEPALQNSDFVMTLRVQKERQTPALQASADGYIQYFQLTHERLQTHCRPSVKVLHPGPVNREVEITSALMDDPTYSLITQQVRNGLALRMAVLLNLLLPTQDVVL
jgi:aspartate carbamoyltransferase catalytic subunit